MMALAEVLLLPPPTPICSSSPEVAAWRAGGIFTCHRPLTYTVQKIHKGGNRLKRLVPMFAAALALAGCSSAGSGPAGHTVSSPWDREKLKPLLPAAGETMPGTQWAVDATGPVTEAKSLVAEPTGPTTILTTCSFWAAAEPGNLFGPAAVGWAGEHLVSPAAPGAGPISVWVVANEPGLSAQQMKEARQLATACAAQDRHLTVSTPGVAGADETLDVRSKTAEMLISRSGDVNIVLGYTTAPGSPNLLDPSLLPVLGRAVTEHAHAAGLPAAN